MKKEKKQKTGIPRLLELAEQKKAMMLLGALLSAAAAVLQLSPYLAVYKVLEELLRNAAFPGAVRADYMIRWAIFGIGGLALGYVFMYVGGMIGHIAAYRTLYSIRVKLSEHMGRLPLGWFSRNSIGKVKQIAEEDVEQIEQFIAHQFPDMISTLTVIAVMMVIMFQLNFWLALACILPVIAGFGIQFSFMFGSRAQEGLKEYYDALENINASSVQYVRGMPSIKIFGQTVHSFRKFYRDIQAYRDMTTRYADSFEPCYVLFRVIVLSLTTFMIPVGMLFLTRDPSNMAFALVLLFMLVFGPAIAAPVFKFNNFGSSFNSINEGGRRIDEILGEKPLPEPAESRRPQGYEIVFRNVCFSYEQGREVLHDVSFTAPQGKITALVGPSGSGKSTAAQLIPRFWDVDAGSILIGGVDVRQMNTEELMNSMSFVFQDCFLFSDTIFNNIAVGKPGATREQVLAAGEAAQCQGFISRLPEGYDTQIGEGGVYLSGGEAQRVSVARAILKNAPILILDEATAYADPENEYHMQLALQELIRNKTVIIIAHRLMTIRNADRILVLEKGRIRESGTHEALLQQKGLYERMWNAYTASASWELGRGRKGQA